MTQLSENETRQIFYNALRTVLVSIILSDGAATESEITQLVSVWKQLTQELVDKDIVQGWCIDVGQDKTPMETHFKALTSVASDKNKGLAFKAAYVLSVSDGTLQKPEIDLLNQMAAYLQLDRERIAALIQELKSEPNTTTTRTYSSQPRKGISYGRLILILAIIVVGYSAIRYFIDRNNYKNGHQAYQQAECAVAITHFEKIINGWRLVDIGEYPALAQQEKAECIPFQTAVDRQQAGDFSMALVAYTDFVTNYSSSVLAEVARNKSKSLFEQAKPLALANLESCERLDSLLEKELIPQRDINLPLFYLACGQVYDKFNNYQQESFGIHESLLTEYPSHSLAGQAEASLFANPVACKEVDSLKKNNTIANRRDFIPTLYYSCGQAYENDRDWGNAILMYESLLTEYPNHSLSGQTEASLFVNPVACEEIDSLKKNNTIANRRDFIPTLYYNCGQAYENDRDWGNAILMYENFLADYPSHSLASDAEAALARSIVAQAKAAGAGQIPAPESSGSTGSELTEVIIQNDSPNRLRIVFSGPESHVEELGACSSCTSYIGDGPLFCPEKGPIGRYTLDAGQYDVVVESISGSGTTPWTGTWDLVSGDEYFNCFFVVTTFGP